MGQRREREDDTKMTEQITMPEKNKYENEKLFIGICDDDKIWCERAAKTICSFCKKIEREAEILLFYKGQELLDYNGQPIDMIFLDIELDDIDGISLAKKMNSKFPKCQIVYLTNYLYYAVEIFETKHIYYVLKGELEVRLPEVFNKAISLMEKRKKKMIFKVIKGREVMIWPDDIYFLERELRYTIIHTSWGDFRVREKLDDLIEQFSDIDFSRCHHSYIINFAAVREKKKESYILENGREVTISRGYAKQTNDAWMRWVLLQMS